MKRLSIFIIVCLTICISLSGCHIKTKNISFDELTKSVVYLDDSISKKYDTEGLVNAVTNEKMSAIVTVYAEHYTDFLGITVSSVNVYQGSGGIFHYENGVYYVLTNNHVVCKDAGYKSQDIYVEDCYGNRYDAYVYRNPAKSVDAISPLYDLAVICFNKGDTSLSTLDFATSNPLIGDKVVLVGSPQGQKNAILLGTVKDYVIPKVEDSTANKIDFEIVSYSVSSKQGSSGGPLLDSSLKIVGVHFGGGETQTREYGGAVPLLKVKEFLNEYCLS